MMKRLLCILLFSLAGLIAAGQTINMDTLLLIDSNAVSKGKLYYLRISGDTLFINSDTVVAGAGDSFWTLTGNYLYPKNTTDSVGIGNATPTEILDVKGNLRLHNPDSGYSVIRFGDTTVSYIGSSDQIYINDWAGVRITGGLPDSLRFSQIWAEGESVGMTANYSLTSWGGIFFNGGYESTWYVHEGSIYGGVVIDTNAFYWGHNSQQLNLGIPANPWKGTFTDFLQLTPTDTEPSPATEGRVYYDLSEHRIKVYNGTAWKAVKWTDD